MWLWGGVNDDVRAKETTSSWRLFRLPLPRCPDEALGKVPLRWEAPVTVKSKPRPCKRSGHAAVLHRGKMYVHGGYALHDGSVLSDLWELAFEGGLRWRELKPQGDLMSLPADWMGKEMMMMMMMTVRSFANLDACTSR